MELGLREWLIIIGLIVIAAILFDGWRRIRGSRSKLRLDKSFNKYTDYTSNKDSIKKAPEQSPLTEPPTDNEEPFFLSADDQPKANKSVKQEQQIKLDLADDDNLKNTKSAKNKKNKIIEELPEENKPLPIEEVLIINVVSQDPEGFKGPALLQNILESGLRFGEMEIFHRHESMTGNGERYFSMANGVKPGTFDLDDIDHFSTRAVSFFLGLPGPKHPKRAFDVMLSAARKLSNELNGALLDDQHSVITAQTIEHYRQRIVEFERRKLKKRY